MRRILHQSRFVIALWLASFSIFAPPSLLAETVQFDGTADAVGAWTYISSPFAVMNPAMIETLGVLVSGGSGTIASESAMGAHVLSIPAAAYSAIPRIIPIACEASAPPDASDSDAAFSVDVPGFLSAQSLSCATSAFDGSSSTGAQGTAGAVEASLNGGLVTAGSAADSTSSVHSLGEVESRGFAELTNVGLLEGAVTADVIRGRATAFVRAGDPGAAMADPQWEVQGLRVLGQPVTIGPGGMIEVSPDTLAMLGILWMSAGWNTSLVSPEGDRAEAEVEALHIALASGVEISLGRAKVMSYAVTIPSAVRQVTFGRLKQAFLPPTGR
jgi:hypothetical protein